MNVGSELRHWQSFLYFPSPNQVGLNDYQFDDSNRQPLHYVKEFHVSAASAEIGDHEHCTASFIVPIPRILPLGDRIARVHVGTYDGR